MLQGSFSNNHRTRKLRRWTSLAFRAVLRLWKSARCNPLNSRNKLSKVELSLIQDSEAFCVLPWKNLFIHAGGQARPCCMFLGSIRSPDGSPMSVHTHTLEAVWDSDQMRDIRKQMLNGTRVSGCSSCYEIDAKGGFSFRKQMNQGTITSEKRLALHLVNLLKSTTVPNDSRLLPSPTVLQLEVGNLCNLKCRMCSGNLSSRIALDPVHDQWAGEEGHAPRPGPVGEWFRNKEVVQNHILQHPDQIEWIEFQGGETLLAKEVKDVLQYLIDAKVAPNIEIGVVTNATTTRSPWLKLTERFKRLNLTISVDGFGKYFEYIRYPAKWNTLVENLEVFRTMPNTSTQVNVTFQNYNALNIVDLFRYLDSIGMDFFVNPLTNPVYLNATNMPSGARRLAAERLRHYARENCRPKNRTMIQGIIGHLDQAGDDFNEPLMMREFMLFTNDLDASRGQSFGETHEELLGLIRETGFEWTSETRFAGRPSSLSLTVLPDS
jgi:MoaA/NifB/PqqE/SkfB family radical SAM enzyme